jgi:hypothetical protein
MKSIKKIKEEIFTREGWVLDYLMNEQWENVHHENQRINMLKWVLNQRTGT